MQGSPINRLERYWTKTSAPEAAQYAEPDTLSEKAKSWEENLEGFMGDHPKLTVAAAVALGLVLGWMVKRK